MYNMDDDFADLLLIPGVGQAKAKALYSAGYKTLSDIAAADPLDMAKVPGIGLDTARDILDFVTVMMSAKKELEEPAAPKELLICPLCGSMVSSSSSVCPGCGVTFSDEVEDQDASELNVSVGEKPDEDGFWYKKKETLFICPECGSLVSDGSDSCPKCGVVFEGEEEGEEALPTPGDADGYWYKEGATLFMCPNCGSFIREDAQSCSSCGIVFEEEEEESPPAGKPVCPMCGVGMAPDSDTCANCGFDFTREKENDGFWYKEKTTLFMCPDCGAFIPKSASKCANCGAMLEEGDGEEPPAGPMTCPMCKNVLPEGARTCANCGFDFTAEKEKDGFWYKDKPVSLFICPGCGAFLSEAAESCLNCGLVFDGEAEPGDIPDADTIAREMTSDIDSKLKKQVDDLIELVEMEDELEQAAGGRGEEPAAEKLAEEGDALLTPPSEGLYLCPICGAFIQQNILKCPSCGAAFDDIEEMALEPAGSVLGAVENPEELAREMAAEIDDIEAELLAPAKAEKKGGVSKDFLDRWKKLDAEELPPIELKKTPETDRRARKEIQELEEIFVLGEPELPEEPADGFWADKAKELAATGKVEEAVAFLDRGVELNPEREMEYKRLMLQLMGVSHKDEPVDVSELMAVDEIGELAIDEGLLAQKNISRIEDIDSELVGDPDNGTLWQEKGELLDKLGRHEEAVKCFDRSIAISYSELRKEQKKQVARQEQPAIGLTNGQGRVDGRVNGLLLQRGLTNGAKLGMTNGKVNGLTNGRVNGLLIQRGLTNGAKFGMTNGKVNGLTNGGVNGAARVPGKVNGLSPGRVNGLRGGFTNGRTNGLTNGESMGMINGAGLGSGGLVNGLGLVNGEGMVNGAGSFRRLRQRRRERILWRHRLTALVLLVALVLMVPMMGNLMLQEERGGISIDGDFSDWNDVRGYYNFMQDGQIAPGLAIRETRISIDNSKLSLFVRFEADAFVCQDGTVNSLWVMVDADSDAGTGYDAAGMGVDMLAEIYGWNGTVMGTNLLRFDNQMDRDDWNGFLRAGSVSAACSGPVLEASFNINADAHMQQREPRVLVLALDSQGNSDITDYFMVPEAGGAVAAYRHEAVDVIQPGSTQVLGWVTLSSHSGVAVSFTRLEFEVTGNGNSTDILEPTLTTEAGQTVATVTAAGGGGFSLEFAEALEVPLNQSITLSLRGLIANGASGKTLGISLAGAAAEGAQTRAVNRNAAVYNVGEPGGKAVDGAFGDWAGATGADDPLNDVVSGDPNALFVNRNIDLARTMFALEGGSLFFCLSVNGIMMGGDALPTVRYRPGPPQPPGPADSDRDTVPDHLDPHPFDFTNDGTLDSDMVTAGGLPDVDGDGIGDYPHGPDRWLNTTIPEDFPEPYAGRAVSIYIGPIEAAHVEQKGDDRAYILVDSDNNPATGLDTRGGFGIDRAVVISGKNNRILAAELYRHDPGNSETGWTFMGDIDAALDWSRMEGAVGLSSLGLTPGDGFTVYVSTEDWRGSRDSADLPHSSGVPPAGGTRSPTGDNVVMNEIYAFGVAEWVELCNPTDAEINIGGWTLRLPRGGSGNYNNVIYTFPAGTAIGAFGSGSEYLVISLNNRLPDGGSGMRLQSGGTVIDHVDYTAGSGMSYARFKSATWGLPTDTDGAGDWYASSSPTQGAPNDKRAPSITVSKTGNTGVASPGGLVTYTIWYNNTGDGNARNVWVNDTLPSGMSFESSGEPYSWQSGQDCGWHFTNVAPGTHFFTITASVDSGVSQGTVLTNTANLDYTDQLSKPQTASVDTYDITVVAPQPILSLIKAADKTTAFPGEAVTFTISYDNVGSVSADHVWLNDTLPAGMNFVSGNPAPDYQSGQDVRWHFTDVGPGAHSVSLQAGIDIGVAPGTVLTNTVTCDYKDSTGTSMPRQTAMASVTVGNAASFIVINEVVSRPDPEWVELANPAEGPADIGGWTIRVQAGASGNYNTVHTFSPGTTIGAFGSGSEYVAAYLPGGSLHNGGRAIRLYNSAGAVIDSTAYPAMVDGQSWARFKHEDTGNPDDGFYISNDGWLVPEGPTPGAPNDRKMPIMSIEKAVAPISAEPGEIVTYTITYSNTGDGNAKDVWVNDTLPAGVDFVSATPAPTDVSGQELVWFFNNVVHGTTNYITINARVNDQPADGEEVINAVALVYHDALRRPMGTVRAWANFTSVRANITVSKVADVSNVLAGGTIVYTIYYNNTGSANASSVWINDTLPAGVTFVSSTPAPDTVSGQELQWHFTNVAPGTHSITVTVTVDSNATGTLTNWAFLDYSSGYGYGLEPSSDSAAVVVPEMRHLALPVLGIMLVGLVALRRRRKDGKEI